MQGDLLGATIFLDSSLICNWMYGLANYPWRMAIQLSKVIFN